MRHFTKKKYSNDGASAVFVSSVMGVLGQPGKIGYCSSKAAVLGMVKASALEFAKRKIRVNAVCPVYTITPMVEEMFEVIGDFKDKLETSIPMKRFGQAQEVAEMADFLISEKAKSISGQIFEMDYGIVSFKI